MSELSEVTKVVKFVRSGHLPRLISEQSPGVMILSVAWQRQYNLIIYKKELSVLSNKKKGLKEEIITSDCHFMHWE